jgi:hypothetical protein
MILLAVAIVGVFLWGYFTAQLPPPLPAYHPKTTSTDTPTQTQTTTTPAYQANHPFNYGTAQYSIIKIETATELKSGTLTASTSGSFVLVFLSVLDQGMNPLSLAPSDFTLIDNKGRTYTLNQEATNIACLLNDKKNILSESLQPGLSRDGVLAFDVPEAAAGFTLRLSNGYVEVALGQ